MTYLPIVTHNILISFSPLILADYAAKIQNWSTWNRILTGFRATETGSYQAESHYPMLATRYPKAAAFFQNIQWYLFIPSIAATVGCIMQTTSLLNKRFLFIPAELVKPLGYWKLKQILFNRYTVMATVGAWAGLIGVVALAFKVSKLINYHILKGKNAAALVTEAAENNQIVTQKTKYDHPFNDVGTQILLAIRIACGFTSLFLSFTPLSLLCIALEVTSFATIAKRQWIQHSIAIHTNAINAQTGIRITEIALQLFMRIYSFGGHRPEGQEAENCCVCLDPIQQNVSAIDQNPDVNTSEGIFCCSKHKFHVNCITSWINSRMPFLIGGLQNMERHTMKDRTTFQYEVELNSSALPSCPICRAPPEYALTGSVQESGDQSYDLEIKIV